MLENKEAIIDNLLERGLWQEAFVRAKSDTENSLKEIHTFLIDNYKIFEQHKDDDPEEDDTAGGWYDAFINASTVNFLPSIKNLMKVFGNVINELDAVDAVINYDTELEAIRDTINTILQEEE